jgi:hypothetical protein
MKLKKVIIGITTTLICLNTINIPTIFAENYTNNFLDNNISIYNDGIYDTYTHSTLHEYNYIDFEDDKVLITIKHQNSKVNHEWTKEDFGVDNIDYIEDLTKLTMPEDQIRNYLNSVTFRQMLCIHLKETSKDNVLKMIEDIEEKNIPEIKSIYVSAYFNNNITDNNSNTYLNTKNNEEYFNFSNVTTLQKYTNGNSYINVGILEGKVMNNTEIFNNNIVYPFLKNPDDVADSTHATGVASIVADKNIGVAPNITLVSFAKSTTMDNQLKAINEAINSKIPVINCSYGLYFDIPESSTVLPYDEFKDVAQNYAGIIVCSAGNSSIDTDKIPFYPACVDLNNVLDITECNLNGQGTYASYGKNTVDLAAPSSGIKFYNRETNSYVPIDGTSIAAPIVTGTIALLMSYNPDLYTNLLNGTPNSDAILRIKNALMDSSTYSYYMDKDNIAYSNEYYVNIGSTSNENIIKTEKYFDSNNKQIYPVASKGYLNAYGAMKEVSREIELDLDSSIDTTNLKIKVIADNGESTNSEYISSYTLNYEDDLDEAASGNKVFYVPDLNEDGSANYEITIFDDNGTLDNTTDDVIITEINNITTPQTIRNKYTSDNTITPCETNIMPSNNNKNINITIDSYLDGDVTLNNKVTSEDALTVLMYVINKYNIIQTGATSLFDIGHGNITVNGNISSNSIVNVHASNGNFNGKITAPLIQTWGNVNAQRETTMEELISENPFTDNQMTSIFFENIPYIDDKYNNDTYAANNNNERNNININEPLYANTINLQNNININNNIKANGNISISGSVQNDTRCVIYSMDGNINLESENFSFTGLIYAPNGTVTITGNNINITGTIIAKEVIIDGDTVNFNTNNNFLNYTNISDKYINLTNTYLSDLQLFIADMDNDKKITAYDAECILNKVINSN